MSKERIVYFLIMLLLFIISVSIFYEPVVNRPSISIFAVFLFLAILGNKIAEFVVKKIFDKKSHM